MRKSYTPCIRFTCSFPQRECDYQMDQHATPWGSHTPPVEDLPAVFHRGSVIIKWISRLLHEEVIHPLYKIYLQFSTQGVWLSNGSAGYSMRQSYTPCRRFTCSFPHRECDYQMDQHATPWGSHTPPVEDLPTVFHRGSVIIKWISMLLHEEVIHPL